MPLTGIHNVKGNKDKEQPLGGVSKLLTGSLYIYVYNKTCKLLSSCCLRAFPAFLAEFGVGRALDSRGVWALFGGGSVGV